jgi:hypothetical protein
MLAKPDANAVSKKYPFLTRNINAKICFYLVALD